MDWACLQTVLWPQDCLVVYHGGASWSRQRMSPWWCKLEQTANGVMAVSWQAPSPKGKRLGGMRTTSSLCELSP